MSFTCINCGFRILNRALGTKHRNHCPHCLHSRHLDVRPGDRQAACGQAMPPIGLAFKDEGGKKVGELCLVHYCPRCHIVSKNRLAGDDEADLVLDIYHRSLTTAVSSDLLALLKTAGIRILDDSDKKEVYTQLYGRPFAEKMLQGKI